MPRITPHQEALRIYYCNKELQELKVDYPDGTVDYIKISDIDDVEVMLLLNLMMSKLYCSKIEFSFGQTFFSEPRNVLKMFLIF